MLLNVILLLCRPLTCSNIALPKKNEVQLSLCETTLQNENNLGKKHPVFQVATSCYVSFKEGHGLQQSYTTLYNPISRWGSCHHVITSHVPGTHQLDYLVDSVDPKIVYVIPKRDSDT